jgi:hypothetical protein
MLCLCTLPTSVLDRDFGAFQDRGSYKMDGCQGDEHMGQRGPCQFETEEVLNNLLQLLLCQCLQPRVAVMIRKKQYTCNTPLRPCLHSPLHTCAQCWKLQVIHQSAQPIKSAICFMVLVAWLTCPTPGDAAIIEQTGKPADYYCGCVHSRSRPRLLTA